MARRGDGRAGLVRQLLQLGPVVKAMQSGRLPVAWADEDRRANDQFRC
jgi:hypothetical protein